MRKFGSWLGGLAVAAALWAAGTAPAAATAPTRPLDPVQARLIAEMGAIVPGKTLWVDLHLDIAPGWHTYWRNPGDSGLPTEIAWTLPPGFEAGNIAWPVPERFVEGGVGNYGYSGSADLLVPVAVPAAVDPGGPQRLEAHASWLVCSDICIPGEARLTLDLPVAAAAPPPSQSIELLFAGARARLPQAAGFRARFAVAAKELRLWLPTDAVGGADRAQVAFYPYASGVIDAAAEPMQQKRAGGVELGLQRATGPTATLPDTLAGVLAVRGPGGGEHAYEIAAPRANAPVPADEPAAAWWQALLLAFAGGALLNLMPCVFPVLSLKLIGLAASVQRAEERRHGLAYAAGVVLSFTLLGGLLLAFRAGGAAVGWGFQLQSPVVVAILAYLLFAMGLSLSGVADFGIALGSGSRFAERGGLAGAFCTGVLATVVATPCSAPFMGAALGAALVAPPAAALAIFAALGCGLAAPVVLATAVPAIARLLPRPGAWMLWFKQLLAFPLYATVAWLVWVLIQEVEAADAFVGLLGVVAVAFAVWIYGRTRVADKPGRWLGSGLAAAGTAFALLLAATLTPAGGATATTANAAGGALGYEAFSTERLDRLATEHRPVFVNLTAAWCITCLVNERTALDRDAVRQAFAEHRIVALKGDWTRQDPDITAFLQQFGRSGVPLYLLYDKTGTPTVLPQLLTEAGVLAALEKI